MHQTSCFSQIQSNPFLCRKFLNIFDRLIIFLQSCRCIPWPLPSSGDLWPSPCDQTHIYGSMVIYGSCSKRNCTYIRCPAGLPFYCNRNIASDPSAPSSPARDSAIPSTPWPPSLPRSWESWSQLGTWQHILPFWWLMFFYIGKTVLVAGWAETSVGLRSIE